MKVIIDNRTYTFKPEKCLPLQFLKLITAVIISVGAVLPFALFIVE